MLLPIGTILYLQEGSRKVMIVHRTPIVQLEEGGESYLFDYAACLYPEGITPETVFYFNEENIDEVIFEGYKDEQEERWQRLYKNWIEENKSKYKKGVVTETV